MASSSTKPRLLIVAPRAPWPLTDGGAIRSFHVFRALTERFDVDHASMLRKGDTEAQIRELEKHGAHAHAVPTERHLMRDALNVVPGLIGGTPITYARYNQGGFRRLLARLARERRPDAVFFDHVHITHYRSLFPGVPHAVDTHNNDITMYRRWAENRPDPATRAFGSLQASLCERYLRRVLPEMDVVFTVSEKERAELSAFAPGTTVLSAPNGVDTAYFHSSNIERKPNVLLFLGNMGWLPNADGCEWMLREIMPHIRAARPDAHLILAGHEPRPQVRALAGEGVEVTGFVDDVRPYLHTSTVFVVPLRIGAGTRLKILEAMASRIPVVSTSVGCEGIAGIDGRHLLIRDDPRAFAEAAVQLMTDAPLRARLADAACELVHSTYEWRIVTAQMASAIEQKLAERPLS